MVPFVYMGMCVYFNDAYAANVSGLILAALFCACFSPGESSSLAFEPDFDLESSLDLRSWLVDDVDEVVIIDAVSDEARVDCFEDDIVECFFFKVRPVRLQ